MTSSSEQTTALIAEARPVANAIRSAGSDDSYTARLIDRLADALEAATKDARTEYRYNGSKKPTDTLPGGGWDETYLLIESRQVTETPWTRVSPPVGGTE